LGPAAIKPEGQPISTDTMGQRIVTNYIHKRVGLSFTITKEAMEDNLYDSQFPMQAVSLRNSLRTTKNILGANVLNNGFNPAYPMGDGQPIFSANHPIDGGTFSNVLPVAAGLSETSLEQLIILIQSFPMQSGILAQTMVEKLIVARTDQFNASRLLNSTFRVGVANNDINAIYHGDYVPKGYKVNQYLDASNAINPYFAITDAPDGFKHFQRTPVETDTYVDYPTDNVMCKATERFSFGITNPRGAASGGNI
jgi:hypothetical protein